MRILALGATGAIGGQLIAALAPYNHEIHVTTRQERRSTVGVRYIQGDAQDVAFLQDVLRPGWDVIVDFMVYGTPTFESRIDALLRACGQYIFTSSARVFADSDDPITECSPRLLDLSQDAAFLASDEYALAKARQEDLLRASSQNNWTIIRPYITFGDGRIQLGTLEKEGWLYRALKGRSIIFCDALMGKWTTMTDGADVARMIAELVGRPEARGEEYNLAGSQALTWNDVLNLYLDELQIHLGRRPQIVLQDLDSFCRAGASVPQIIYDRIYNRRFDPTKIGKLFDLDSLADCRVALKTRLRAQLASGSFLPLNGRDEALRDRASSAHTPLRDFPSGKHKLAYIRYRYIPYGLMRAR